MKFLTLTWLLLGAQLAGAALEFQNELQEIHADLGSKTVTSDFKFTNKGKDTVRIREADAGCSCIAVQISGGKLLYAPGETGTIRAVFEIGTFQGAVDKPIHLWLDSDPDEKPSSSVMLRVHIPVIISMEPKTLKWTVGAEAAPQLIDVRMSYEKPISVTSVGTSSGAFSARLITVEEGKHYQIEITPASTAAPSLCVVRVETNVDVEKYRVQQGFAVVQAQASKP
jgi:hypothetical protein